MTTASNALLSSSKPAHRLELLKSGYQRFLYRRRRAQLQRRRTTRIERELGAYTDRELADLGLARSDIRDVASGAFRRA